MKLPCAPLICAINALIVGSGVEGQGCNPGVIASQSDAAASVKRLVVVAPEVKIPDMADGLRTVRDRS